MKKIIFLSIITIFLYSSDDINSSKSLQEYKITKKMKIFQNKRSKNEEESKKLEEDGFCPCSIQQP